MNKLDIVYVLKKDENNTDLKYSLRSLINVTGYNKVWFIGYAPTWTKPDGYINVMQYRNKWLNSLNNVIAACKHPKITNNFVLFNDDFFAINKVNLLTDLNCYCGSLDKAINKYRNETHSRWRDAHQQTKDLLEKLNIKHFDNFALHIPTIFNRQKFLNMVNMPEIKRHIKICGILQYRSVYGNMYWDHPTKIKDVKLKEDTDITDERLKNQWVSVRDDVTNNLDKFPNLKKCLIKLPKSKYEI